VLRFKKKVQVKGKKEVRVADSEGKSDAEVGMDGSIYKNVTLWNERITRRMGGV
jgi:hypothetical protein